MMKTIMILGASILQMPAIEKAKEMGLSVVAVDMNPNAIGFSVSGIKKEVISTIDTPLVLDAAKRHRIDGIITLASDMPMQTVATVCRELNLIGISEDTALKATNKAYMRDALKNSGVPIPKYYRVRGKDDFKESFKKLMVVGNKCIIKPADNSGSRGVLLLDKNSDLDSAYEYTIQHSREGEVVVEEYMEGPEVSVETIAINGKVHVIQITDKLTTGAPHFVEMGHSQPCQLDEKTKNSIREIAINANKAIGITNGPSHTEIIVDKNEPKIVEIGARLGGDCITTHLVPLSTGIDMVEACIQIALGDIPNLQQQWNKGSAIRYFDVDHGVVLDVLGLEEIEKIDGIVQVSIIHGVGETIGDIKNSMDRTGFVIAQADSAQTAIKTAEDGLKKIQFIIK